MKVLIDTNIILDLILQREQVDVASKLIALLRNQNHEIYMTEGGFYGMIYTVDNYLRKVMGLKKPERTNTLRSIMAQVLNFFQVAGHDNKSLLEGVNNMAFTDIEDSCQYQAAIRIGCSHLLTFNIKDYFIGEDAPVKVLSPQQYLNLNVRG